MSNSVFGGNYLDLGPCHLYYDTASGGANVFLGKTGSTTVKFSVSKTDLTSSQDGSEPADRVQTGDMCSVEATLAQPTLERLAKCIPGVSLNYDTDGVTVLGASFASDIGTRDSSIAKELKLVRISGGEDSTDPFDTVYFWLAAAVGSAELAFDAGTQRFVNVQWQCYKSTNHLDVNGRPTYWGIANYNAVAP
jgi:hypothetical protein